MPLPMLGERRAVRLRSDLDVTVVHHAYLPRDRHAAVLVFPYGLRHEPGRAPGTLAALALHLGGPEGPAALGHETLTLAVDGPDLPQLLAALAARVAAPPPRDLAALWDRASAWRHEALADPVVQVMNAAHARVFVKHTSLAGAWPYGPRHGGVAGSAADVPPPPAEPLALRWRWLHPGAARLVVVSPLTLEAAEAAVAESPLARWSPPSPRPGPAAPQHPGVRGWRAWAYDAPPHTAGALIALVVPTVGQDDPAGGAFDALRRALRSIAPEVRASYWPHPEAGVLALWAPCVPTETGGGRTTGRALRSALRALQAAPGALATVGREAVHGTYRDLRRLRATAPGLAAFHAYHGGHGAPTAPPQTPPRDADELVRIASLAVGCGAPRFAVVRAAGVDVDVEGLGALLR